MGKKIFAESVRIRNLLKVNAFWKKRCLQYKVLLDSVLKRKQKANANDVAVGKLPENSKLKRRREEDQTFESNAGQSSKKPKLADKDPFKILHSDVHDLITNHLKASDMSTMTEVSTEWRDRFEPEFIQQTTLIIDIPSIPQITDKLDFIRLMSRSKREYRNVKVIIGCETSSDSFNILRQLAPSIETLEVSSFSIHSSSLEQQNPIPFPSLKSLTLGKMSAAVDQLILSQNLNLTSLVLTKSFNVSAEIIENLLQSLPNLKNLELSCCDPTLQLIHGWEENLAADFLPFHLTKLKINLGTFMVLFVTKPPFVNGMRNFLRSQAASLKEVYMNCVPDTAILNTIFNELPALQKVEVAPIFSYFIESVEEAVESRNDNIKFARISNRFPEEDVRQIMRAMPAVSTLEVRTLTYDLILLAVEHFKNLKTILYGNLEEHCLELFNASKRNNREWDHIQLVTSG